MMNNREKINDLIEAYARAVRDKDPLAVSELFAEDFNHVVHGLGTDPNNPWNTKKETTREGIRKIYEQFFTNVTDMEVMYSERIIDKENNSAAMIVRVNSDSGSLENALHIKWNQEGRIIFFYNWYGQSMEKIIDQ